MNNLSVAVARSSLSIIASLSHKGFLVGLGISQADYDKLVGDGAWSGADRARMSNLMHTLANGSTDSLGLPRFQLPAEYIAATIVTFVHPVNIHAACIFAPPSPSAEVLGDGSNPVRGSHVTPEQLFALCQQLYVDDKPSAARAQFERKLGLISDSIDDLASAKQTGGFRGR